MTTARDIDLARARVCYLVRALWRRVDFESIQANRRRSLTAELAEQLFPMAASERSTLGWVRALAARFAIELTAGARSSYPASVILPECFLEDGTPHDEVSTDSAGDVRVRWDVLVGQISFEALRIALHDGSYMVATFATAERLDGESSLFQIAPAPSASASAWVPRLPKNIIAPRSFRAVWTVVSPLHHGHDEKSGNVSMFRRQRTVDPTTGDVHLVPFVSGNAVRGLWRDRIFSRLMSLVGLRFSGLPPQRAHSLLSGGTIEAGADGTKVDVALRRRAREICPAWDLIAGCIDGQIMKGLLNVSDAELVCRENAWKLHTTLAPGMDFEAFRESLRAADDMTQLRLLVRHAHRDIERSDGQQMLVNVEGILPGAQLVQRFSLHGLDGVRPLAKSCMADLLSEFRSNAFVGAKNAAGYGEIALDAYIDADGVELGGAEDYVAWVSDHADEIRGWLLATDKPDVTAAQAPDLSQPRRRAGKKVQPEVGF